MDRVEVHADATLGFERTCENVRVGETCGSVPKRRCNRWPRCGRYGSKASAAWDVTSMPLLQGAQWPGTESCVRHAWQRVPSAWQGQLPHIGMGEQKARRCHNATVQLASRRFVEVLARRSRWSQAKRSMNKASRRPAKQSQRRRPHLFVSPRLLCTGRCGFAFSATDSLVRRRRSGEQGPLTGKGRERPILGAG